MGMGYGISESESFLIPTLMWSAEERRLYFMFLCWFLVLDFAGHADSV